MNIDEINGYCPLCPERMEFRIGESYEMERFCSACSLIHRVSSKEGYRTGEVAYMNIIFMSHKEEDNIRVYLPNSWQTDYIIPGKILYRADFERVQKLCLL